MKNVLPAEVSTQLSQVIDMVEHHLASAFVAAHLYGSALDGGLKPYSDIDVLVTADRPLDDAVRQALLLDLLTVSAPPGQSEALRAMEVTVVVRSDVVPWRYPPRRELQFGEWLRADLLSGIFEPAGVDPDLAILLTQARRHSMALIGPAAKELFDPVPEDDLYRVLLDTLKLWNSFPDWEGDERNVVLTLARIWFSAATGKIMPKNIAADWVMERLPIEHQPVLREARQAYLGQTEDRLACRADEVAEFILFVKHKVIELLGTNANASTTDGNSP